MIMWSKSLYNGDLGHGLVPEDTMKTSATICILVGLISTCLAHLCLITPKQRGSLTGLNQKGSNDCILLASPCGNRPPEKAEGVWQANGNFTVIFQKNLDHWTASNPGYFAVSLVGQDLQKELIRVPDRGEPSLHLYTVSGPLPKDLKVGTGYYVQVTYVTKNPDAPPVFYQCADVMIM